MKKWICFLAALLFSASLLVGKEGLVGRALEAPSVETTVTEPTQPEKTVGPMVEKPNFQDDDF